MTNLETILNEATPVQVDAGLNWYRVANQTCTRVARELDIPASRFIAAVAALSPGLRWDRNIDEARLLARAWRRSEELPHVGVYGRRNVYKAVACLEGTDPLELFSERTSPKVRAFYRCILEPETCTDVVVDRHAYAAAYNFVGPRGGSSEKEAGKLTLKRYQEIAELYRSLAQDAGLLPHQVQAVVWTAWRDSLKVF